MAITGPQDVEYREKPSRAGDLSPYYVNGETEVLPSVLQLGSTEPRSSVCGLKTHQEQEGVPCTNLTLPANRCDYTQRGNQPLSEGLCPMTSIHLHIRREQSHLPTRQCSYFLLSVPGHLPSLSHITSAIFCRLCDMMTEPPKQNWKDLGGGLCITV